MKWPSVLSGCLLLLVTLTEAEDLKLTVQTVSDGIKISCKPGLLIKTSDLQSNITIKGGFVEYRDDNSGEYQCVVKDNSDPAKIFVKFRSCDNCVNLDMASIVGLIMGDVVATILVGAAVYLLMTKSRASQFNSQSTSHHKSSARELLIPNEVTSRSNNEPYQRLRAGRRIDTYDEINKK
ncbi:T-cell surface glycoprotein CD3 delta chain [Echeneis naucrates]|uniref:CD3 gamma/delta subunit Ig-like domain-containing protein n=1 Tax=Echeneis naucrates TaxID=173247 RepID=A0A665U0J5_ECHNA|nr:T-cell surface glycoprotein CD3 delta chain [Echeneis naucrates]XP_029374256.1 T-cell surface glycoprotein CD3 delta chain [Echeneis naucrates]